MVRTVDSERHKFPRPRNHLFRPLPLAIFSSLLQHRGSNFKVFLGGKKRILAYQEIKNRRGINPACVILPTQFVIDRFKSGIDKAIEFRGKRGINPYFPNRLHMTKLLTYNEAA